MTASQNDVRYSVSHRKEIEKVSSEQAANEYGVASGAEFKLTVDLKFHSETRITSAALRNVFILLMSSLILLVRHFVT
jgi:hypothetical protein